jgi:hypothetical protein
LKVEDFEELKLCSPAICWWGTTVSEPANQLLSSASVSAALAVKQELNKTPGYDESRESLGLLLSCHLAELHGGQISVQGSLAAGYRYVVNLPQLESAAQRL